MSTIGGLITQNSSHEGNKRIFVDNGLGFVGHRHVRQVHLDVFVASVLKHGLRFAEPDKLPEQAQGRLRVDDLKRDVAVGIKLDLHLFDPSGAASRESGIVLAVPPHGIALIRVADHVESFAFADLVAIIDVGRAAGDGEHRHSRGFDLIGFAEILRQPAGIVVREEMGIKRRRYSFAGRCDKSVDSLVECRRLSGRERSLDRSALPSDIETEHGVHTAGHVILLRHGDARVNFGDNVNVRVDGLYVCREIVKVFDRLGRIGLLVGTVLDEISRGVDAESVDAFIDPELGDLAELVADRGIVMIQVGDGEVKGRIIGLTVSGVTGIFSLCHEGIWELPDALGQPPGSFAFQTYQLA